MSETAAIRAPVQGDAAENLGVLASAVGATSGSEASATPTGPAKPPLPEDTFAALKAIAEISGLMGVLAFTAGWSYMASYYMSFGLNPMELDFSVAATSAFALHMLVKSEWQLLAAVAVLALLVLFNAKLGSARKLWAGAAVLGLLVMVALTGAARGRQHAAEDMFDTGTRLASVTIASVATFEAKSPVLERVKICFGENQPSCKLLLHGKGIYYIFRPLKDEARQSQFKNLNLYMLPESDVAAVHLSRGIE